jgi:hypothetical protein
VSLVRDVAAALAGAGFKIVRSGAEPGRCRLAGVQGWDVWCDEVGNLESAAQVVVAAKARREKQDDGERAAVVLRYKSQPRVLILLTDIASAVRAIRTVGANNRAAIASASRVLARAEETLKPISCGYEKLRGCLLPLETWVSLLLAWRVVVCAHRRQVPPMPKAEGVRIGPRTVAHDYHAVRLAQVEHEVDENLRRHSKTLWGSVMGTSAWAGVATASSMSVGREESSHGEGSGGEES